MSVMPLPLVYWLHQYHRKGGGSEQFRYEHWKRIQKRTFDAEYSVRVQRLNDFSIAETKKIVNAIEMLALMQFIPQANFSAIKTNLENR